MFMKKFLNSTTGWYVNPDFGFGFQFCRTCIDNLSKIIQVSPYHFVSQEYKPSLAELSSYTFHSSPHSILKSSLLTLCRKFPKNRSVFKILLRIFCIVGKRYKYSIITFTHCSFKRLDSSFPYISVLTFYLN